MTSSSDPDPPQTAPRRSPLPPGTNISRAARTSPKRPSRGDLEQMLRGLDVNIVKLTECLVTNGWCLPIEPVGLPGLHYVLVGRGVMTFENGQSTPLSPHTLVIQPSSQAARVDVPGADGICQQSCEDALVERIGDGDAVPRRFVAGDGPPALIFVCGYFDARHGRTIDLFSRLTAPIVEEFDRGDGLDAVLKDAISELLRQDLGMGVMTSALLKQVLVQLFRRALASTKAWVDNLAILGDAQISRAFAEMVARPGADHSVRSLARTAGLSRSIFMTRFAALLGQPPMSVLRDLRMRQAASLLATGAYQIDQVAHLVGYANRSSFCRAFSKSHAVHPSAYLALEQEAWEESAASED